MFCFCFVIPKKIHLKSEFTTEIEIQQWAFPKEDGCNSYPKVVINIYIYCIT